MPSVTQHNFSAGELAPAFYGRSDLERYHFGAASIENLVVTQVGSLKRRPGLARVKALGFQARVFSLNTSSGPTWGLFDVSGVTVGDTVMPWPAGAAYVVSDLKDFQLCQCGDILSFVCPGHPVVELLNNAGALSLRLRPGNYIEPNNPAPDFFCLFKNTEKRNAFPLLENFGNVGDSFFDFGDVTRDDFHPQLTELSKGLLYDARLCPDSVDYPALPWVYKVSFLYDDEVRGEVEAISPYEFSFNVPLYLDYVPFYIYVSARDRALGTPKSIRVYRGRDGIFGLVGESTQKLDGFAYKRVTGVNKVYSQSTQTLAATGGYFLLMDNGMTPDLSIQPPAPLEDNNSLFVESNSYPNSMCFFEQRTVFGGHAKKPRNLYFSRSGGLYEFAKNADYSPLASDAMSLEFASTEHERIQSLTSINGRLIVLTDKNLWAVGSSEGALTPTTASAVAYSGIGSSRLQPLTLRNTCLFVSAAGNQIFEIRADQNGTQWATRELGTFARHLLDGHKIVSWCYQATPDPIVWMVREDGLLLSMTYSFESQIVAWAHHKTNSTVYSVACVEDEVYLSVKRGSSFQIEKMDFIGQTAYLDGAFACASPMLAAASGLQGWRDVTFSALPVGEAVPCGIPGQAVSGSCLAGVPVEAELRMLDAIDRDDLGLRPKTLHKISVDFIGSGSLLLSESLNASATAETVSGTCSRKILDSNIIHSYGFEALGVVASKMPCPLVVLGVSREVDFGNVPLSGSSSDGGNR